jgi:hypothetical protein
MAAGPRRVVGVAEAWRVGQGGYPPMQVVTNEGDDGGETETEEVSPRAAPRGQDGWGPAYLLTCCRVASSCEGRSLKVVIAAQDPQDGDFGPGRGKGDDGRDDEEKQEEEPEQQQQQQQQQLPPPPPPPQPQQQQQQQQLQPPPQPQQPPPSQQQQQEPEVRGLLSIASCVLGLTRACLPPRWSHGWRSTKRRIIRRRRRRPRSRPSSSSSHSCRHESRL